MTDIDGAYEIIERLRVERNEARAEVERLRAIVASQDRQLASYDTQVTEQAKWIGNLRAELAAVPVAAIKRYWDMSNPIEAWDAAADECLVVYEEINKWLELADGAE